MSVLLIHPPIAKACEPPAGLARLAGALNRHGVSYKVVDANLEGTLNLLGRPLKIEDTYTRRACRHLEDNLRLLHSLDGYRDAARYRRVVTEVDRVLERSGAKNGSRVGLANYQDSRLSPMRSRDLIRAAEDPSHNPFYPYFAERLTGLLHRHSPSTVGFSLNYLSQALCAFAMIGWLRKLAPGLTIVLGGGLVTSWMKRPQWRNPFSGLVDHLVPGPGERPLLSLLGCQWREGHNRPDYTVFPMESYLSPGPVLPYSGSSGCYWQRCSFCPERAEKNPYMPLEPETVLDDLRALKGEVRPLLAHLLDNAVSPGLLKEIVRRPPGVPWYGFTRVSDLFLDQAFCMALKRSGGVMLKLGLESGDQGVLDALGKGVRIEVASAALKNLKSAGIATYVYLLFGTPPETHESAQRTLDFTVIHASCIDFLNLALFNLPTFGPDAERFQTNAFYEGDLSLYRDFKHPEGWDRPLVRQFLDRVFKKHPNVSAILKRVPPIFTSNHAPFFLLADQTAPIERPVTSEQ
jgi:Radical SAM superfamily